MTVALAPIKTFVKLTGDPNTLLAENVDRLLLRVALCSL